MKIAKTSKQRNFVVDADWYGAGELNQLLEGKTIFYLKGKSVIPCYDKIEEDDVDKFTFRIFTKNCESITVRLDDFDYYGNYAKLKKAVLLRDSVQIEADNDGIALIDCIKVKI